MPWSLQPCCGGFVIILPPLYIAYFDNLPLTCYSLYSGCLYRNCLYLQHYTFLTGSFPQLHAFPTSSHIADSWNSIYVPLWCLFLHILYLKSPKYKEIVRIVIHFAHPAFPLVNTNDFLARRWFKPPLNLALEGRGRWTSVSLRSAWSTVWLSQGYTEKHCLKKNKQ